ncbi:MAG: hypothetical protein ACPHRO_14735, partial [Nannocystaceae bacterium]
PVELPPVSDTLALPAQDLTWERAAGTGGASGSDGGDDASGGTSDGGSELSGGGSDDGCACSTGATTPPRLLALAVLFLPALRRRHPRR